MTIIHTRVDESAFVRESATVSVGDLGQAGVKSAHGVTVRVGAAEEYFEGAFIRGHVHNNFLNSSMVNPASLIIPAIVNALIGLLRGMMIIRSSFAIEICFPSRMTRKLAFSKALIARWC